MSVIKRLLFVCALLFSQLVSAATIWKNPAAYPEGMDLWFGSVYNTTPSHDYQLRIGGWGDTYQTLLRFDLSGLPRTADAAYVWLYYFNSGTPTNINWYLVTNQWQSGTVGSSTEPSGAFVGATAAPAAVGWYKVNVTSFYNQWRLGGNYGFQLKPVSNNNNYTTFYSSTQGGGIGPWLQVDYTPTATDSVIKLKWPLSTPRSSLSVNLGFGGQSPITCTTDGRNKEHNGTDYSASMGTAVYAAEDGVIKEILTPSQTGGWAYNIVMEHNHPTGGKFTTVYWHVTPSSGVVVAPAGQTTFIPRGMQIATVADLAPYGHGTHFHFGVRVGAYTSNVSGLGALPYAAYPCLSYPVFPAGFINPEDLQAPLNEGPVFYLCNFPTGPYRSPE